ncbi:hypothetical protein PHO31112_02125 [Pandoraea horticolens]|uniref:Uncharacterized protein n=1 Tax=Pandoraea horticolens TaxID=2508298 RepID=A0A5E4UMS3_9BURK|nr:hypothetical protein PHO31112_02125 [Pandoraea horticolens]
MDVELSRQYATEGFVESFGAANAYVAQDRDT